LEQPSGMTDTAA